MITVWLHCFLSNELRKDVPFSLINFDYMLPFGGVLDERYISQESLPFALHTLECA